MLDLKKLEINRLIKEFEYLESDYNYKSELIRDADSNFLENINKILDKNNELKIIYDKKTSKNIFTNKSKIEEEIQIDDFKKDNRSDKIKKLYREIVKITHPDKIKNKKLNNLYIEAHKFYEINDIIGIYKICEDLFIEYEVDPSDVDIIKENIQNLKERISFIESTHIWGWYNIEEKNKNKVVLDFIRSKIIDQDI